MFEGGVLGEFVDPLNFPGEELIAIGEVLLAADNFLPARAHVGADVGAEDASADELELHGGGEVGHIEAGQLGGVEPGLEHGNPAPEHDNKSTPEPALLPVLEQPERVPADLPVRRQTAIQELELGPLVVLSHLQLEQGQALAVLSGQVPLGVGAGLGQGGHGRGRLERVQG
jgi:hypothetical protein